MSYEPYNEQTASDRDRVAWALSEIIDDQAPRYRLAAECIAGNQKVMDDLKALGERLASAKAART